MHGHSLRFQRMENKLSLDLSDPAMAEAVKDCKPGDTKTFTVTVTAEVHDGEQFIGNVDEIEYSDDEVEAEDDAGYERGKMSDTVGMPKTGDGRAIMVVLGKRK